MHIHSFSQIFKEDIPMVFRIFARDLKILLHRPVALIIVLGIAFLPSLYAWVNIWANWDPYGNTGNLQVAVASNDAGYNIEGVDINMGESIVDNLHTNDAIGWQFVDEEAAREGVRSGNYYAAVIIPETFSEDVVTFITGETERPAIEYCSNEKKNAIATKITNTGVTTLRTTINEQFVNTVSSTILDVLNLTDNLLSEKGDALVDDLTASLQKTQQDLADFTVSVDALIETARSAQELTAAAQALLPDLDGTVNDNITALENLRLLTKSAGSTGSALTDTLDQNLSALLATSEGLYDNLEDAAADAETISADAAAALDRASATAYAAAGSVKQVRDFLSDNENIFLAMAKRLDDAIDALKGKIPVPLVEADTSRGTLQSALKRAIDKEIAALDQMYSDLRTIGRDTARAADAIRTGGALPAADLAALRSDLKTLRSDLTTVKDSYQSDVAPLLDDTVSQFYTCLDSLSDLLLTTNQNLPLLGNVLTGVDHSLDHAIIALESSKTLIGNAQEDIDSLLTDLNNTEKDARLAKLMDLIRSDPNLIADFIASPVQVNTTHIYPVENYGSAMTPFYSILAIWVGGLLMCSILKTNVREDEKLKRFGPTVAYFGRYCLFALVAVLQALIICLGDLYILRIQCLHPAQFILVGVVAALVYSLMMFTLTVSFKDVGKAIAVIIMVIQVAGSGGTFPVEVLPSFFQAVNPYLPFTFCINAMRECIAGMYANAYALDLIWLCIIYVPISLLIGVVLRRPVIWLMNFFEHQVEKTGLL